MSQPVKTPAAPRSSEPVLQPVGVDAVAFDGGFLGGWQVLNGDATIPHCIEEIEKAGALDNFRRLVGESDAPYRGMPFADTDLYKTLEAIAWEAARTGSDEWEQYTLDAVDLLRRAQAEDGYLNSLVQGDPERERWAGLRWSHELYSLGHLLQAAVARQRATGATDLLDVALRFVDLVEREAGTQPMLDGHPEVETALVELYRTTGDPRHLALAKTFIDRRGGRIMGPDQLGYEYFQDHAPVREVDEAVGHAVRQVYLLAGEVDLLLEAPDAPLRAAVDRLWEDVHERKLYVTGGLGSRHRGEAFGDPFELPSDRAYAETCAAIGALQWNRRMHLLTGESRYVDEMERSLYNAIAVAVATDGKAYFYSNPLHLREGHLDEEDAPSARLGWYACSCCPPNLARLVSSLGAYAFSLADGLLQVDLYGGGTVRWTDRAGTARTATIETDYPWDGAVRIAFDAPVTDPVRLRLPGWAGTASVTVDGAAVSPEVDRGYLVVDRPGMQEIRVDLPVEPEVVAPHDRIDALRGTVSVRRGPVVYCIEQADLPEGVAVHGVAVPAAPEPVLAGVDERLAAPTLTIEGATSRPDAGGLYRGAAAARPAAEPVGTLTLVPYFRWANRGLGAMRVWIPTTSS